MSTFTEDDRYESASHTFTFTSNDEWQVEDSSGLIVATYDLSSQAYAFKAVTESGVDYFLVGTATFATQNFTVDITYADGHTPFSYKVSSKEGIGVADVVDILTPTHIYDLSQKHIELQVSSGTLSIKCDGDPSAGTLAWYTYEEV